MTVYDEKYRDIIIECFKHGERGFDFDNYYSQMEHHWDEIYENKKVLLFRYWELYKKNLPDTMIEFEQYLNSLPSGISFDKQTTVDRDKRKTKNLFARVYYKTKYSIHVSEGFSQCIIKQYDGSRIIIWNYSELKKALQFKERVLSNHREILEPLFNNGILNKLILTKTGFTDYDCKGYGLNKVGMKPLQDGSQIMGLMIAIIENFSHLIPDDEIWCIDKWEHGDSDFDMHISRFSMRPTPQESLNEW